MASQVMQLGAKAETTFGTPVTVDRFYEFLGGESLERQQTVIMPDGLRPSIRTKLGANRRKLVRQWGAGSIPMEVATTGFGLWFKQALGGATVSQYGANAVYLHTYTPGDLGGKSLTIQKGVMEWTTGAPSGQAFTFHGCKVIDWEFAISQEGFLNFTVGVDAEDVDDTTVLAAASYDDLKNFNFKQGVLTVDGSTASGITDATLRGTNALETERFFLGGSGLKEEPVENGYRELSGDISAEFRSVADFYNAFEADTSKAVVLTFEGDAITGTFTEQLTITLHDVRFEGETPKVSGPEPSVQSIPLTAWEQTDGDSITVTYRTSDSTS